MVHAVATAQVPKLTVMIGASHGAGNYAMCGRSYGPRLLFSWPNARISVMGGEQAAMTLLAVKREQPRAQGTTRTPEGEAALTAPTVMVGVERLPSAISSARASRSVETSLATNGMPLCDRNSIAVWQGGQPGWW